MAKSLKTVQYCFPVLTSLTDNVLTALTSITIYLPDIYSGASSIKKVIAILSADDIITATGGTIGTTRMQLGLGGGTKTNISNITSRANTGENVSVFHTFDFTSRFTTSWSGASMTCQADVLIDQTTGTSLGMRNVCVSLDITYEYEDTSNIQVKTVFVPLLGPTGSIAFPTKSSIPDSLVPALETYCPENSKVWLQNNLWMQANAGTTGPTAHTVSFKINTGTAESFIFINALGTDRFHRYINTSILTGMDKNAINELYIYMSGTSATGLGSRHLHPQLWIQSTYQFSASLSTSSLVSLILPLSTEQNGPGSYSGSYYHKSIEFFIPESNIETRSVGFYGYFVTVGNAQPTTHVFQNSTYTSTAGIQVLSYNSSYVAGSNCFGPTLYTNGVNYLSHSSLDLRRGRNIFITKFYKKPNDTITNKKNLSGFYIVNYVADIPSNGIGKMNKTVFYNLLAMDNLTGTTYFTKTLSNGILPIPESKHYISNLGSRVITFNEHDVSRVLTFNFVNTNSSSFVYSTDVGQYFANATGEMGASYIFYDSPKYPKYPNQYNLNIFPNMTFISSSESLFFVMSYEPFGSQVLRDFTLLCTYHGMYWPITGSVYGSNGGTVYLNLIRDSDKQILSQTTVSGNGNFYFDWYDNTEKVFIEAYEDDTHLGRSVSAYAGT